MSRYFQNPFHAFRPVEISPDVIKSRALTCVDHILKKLKANHQNCDGGMLIVRP